MSQVVSIGKIKGKSLKAFVRNMVLTLFFGDKSKYYKFFQKRVEKNGNTTTNMYLKVDNYEPKILLEVPVL